MFVTGCHRSGTSLLSSLMHALVTGQDPRQRLGDLELKLENPLGFFESERLVEINDCLLKAVGCQWNRPPLLPPAGTSPPFWMSFNSTARNSSPTPLIKPGSIRIPVFASHTLLTCTSSSVVSPLWWLFVSRWRLLPHCIRNGFSLNCGLVLWWIYNHHIASQLCSKDLLVSTSLLDLDDHSLQQLLGPFLELHNHQRPTVDLARALITSLLQPQFNRAEAALM